jgi:leader peptidase (prepilin peptidase)/N-methyltransferase
VIEAVLAALFGLIFGSFLNVCIYRLPRDLSVVRPRSFCPACEHPIAWYDNLPLISFLLLGGWCRNCRARISLRYPVVELATAGFFFAAVWMHGPGLVSLKLCVFAALLTGLIFADLEERILPDEFTLGGMAIGFVLSIFVPLESGLAFAFFGGANPRAVSLGESVAGAGLGAGAIWMVGWLYEKIRRREGLGFGDVKMVGMIGAFLGLRQTLLIVLLGSLAGSVGGTLYIILGRKDPSQYPLPYGAFLGAAGLFVAYFGWTVFGPVTNWRG